MNLPTIPSHAVAQGPGRQPPTISKRAGDHRVYVVDITGLLTTDELAIEASCVSHADLIIDQVRSRVGRYFEFRAGGGAAREGKAADYPLDFQIKTTKGYVAVQVVIRVYP